jgi:hypothetical protein
LEGKVRRLEERSVQPSVETTTGTEDMNAAREWLRREATEAPYEGQRERLAALLAKTRRDALERAMLYAWKSPQNVFRKA